VQWEKRACEEEEKPIYKKRYIQSKFTPIKLHNAKLSQDDQPSEFPGVDEEYQRKAADCMLCSKDILSSNLNEIDETQADFGIKEIESESPFDYIAQGW